MLFNFTQINNCTVWKLASVAAAIKSKNTLLTISILKRRVPIESYDSQQCFDTRSHFYIFLAHDAKPKGVSNQTSQKASIWPLNNGMLYIQTFDTLSYNFYPLPSNDITRLRTWAMIGAPIVSHAHTEPMQLYLIEECRPIFS